MRTWFSRILSWIAAALVGGVFGIAGTIGHSLVWLGIPVGIVVGAIACGAILVAIRALTHDRGATLAAALGMLGMVTVISGVGPGGSVVVENTVWGQVWLYVLAGLALLAIAWPRLPQARRERPPVPSAQEESPPIITGVPQREEPGTRAS
ncbi:histidinol dehydrogenase [Microbacterium tumbae]